MENTNQQSNQQITEKPKSELEKKFDKLSKGRQISIIIAFIGLVFGMILTLDLIGFTLSDAGNERMFPFSSATIWIINIGIGIAGGILSAPNKMMAAIVSGAVMGGGITGLTVLYASWRSTLLVYELLIPFFISLIIGFKLYGLLAGESTKLSNDEWSIWTGPKTPTKNSSK